MNSTASPLTDSERGKVARSLNERLADAADLYNGAKMAHWNVRVPNFRELHALFSDVASMLSDQADLIAERVVQLGAMAEGTTTQIGEGTTLDEYPKGLVAGADHLAALLSRITGYNAGLHETMGIADDIGDVNTVTLMSDASLAVEKMAWMLSAHVGVK